MLVAEIMYPESPTNLLIRILLAEGGESVDRILIKDKIMDLMELALKNKVLLHLAEKLEILKLNHLVPNSYRERIRKQQRKLILDVELMEDVTRLAELHGIEFAVVKTIKPITYVGDDVDLLVDRLNHKRLISIITRKLGFMIEGWGPAETTLYKYVDGIKLMLDVHHKLAASTLGYVNTGLVLKTRRFVGVTKPYSNETVWVPTPSPEYSMLITVGHALLKELRVTLADILTTHYLWGKVSRNLLYELATYEGLVRTVNLMNKLVSEALTYKIRQSLPYRPRLSEVLRCYMEKVARTLSIGNYSEVLRLPLTNIQGYGIALKYLRKL